jgi:alanine dehydrogenase
VDIGIPKESRSHEHRVALTPDGVKMLAAEGHRVFVESGAGAAAGHADCDYESAGGSVVFSRMEVFGRAELLLGVYAPDSPEYELLRPGQAVTAFWALPAAHAENLKALRDRGVTAVGIEVIEDDEGYVPVRTSMSEMAGSLAIIVGSGLLLNEFGGRGILLSGAPGVPPGTLVVLGAGVLGRAAARTALGMGAEVVLIDRSVSQLRRAQERLRHPVTTMLSTRPNIERALSFADLVVAAPAVTGKPAPRLVTHEMLRRMRPRSVFMDLSIDMGGCCETSRPASFPNPVYEVDDILHFCAPNLPTIAARSATLAFTNALLPFILELAGKGFERALAESEALRRGTYLHRGRCTMESLARMFEVPWEPLPGNGGSGAA